MIRPHGPNCWKGLGAFKLLVRLKIRREKINFVMSTVKKPNENCQSKNRVYHEFWKEIWISITRCYYSLSGNGCPSGLELGFSMDLIILCFGLDSSSLSICHKSSLFTMFRRTPVFKTISVQFGGYSSTNPDSFSDTRNLNIFDDLCMQFNPNWESRIYPLIPVVSLILFIKDTKAKVNWNCFILFLYGIYLLSGSN